MQWYRRNLSVRGAACLAMSTMLLVAGCDVSVSDREDAATPDPTPDPARETTGSTGPGTGTGAEGTGDADQGALLLIMDASGSMNTTMASGQTRLDGAKQALRDVVEALPEDRHVGLRVYGHRVPNTDRENGCQDTELIHPVSPLDRPALLTAIDQYDAVGYTPIGLALREGAGDLPPEGARTIILVSDGEDTCAPPEPCDVAADLVDGGIDLVIHTVGFALGDNDDARSELGCVAEAGGGEYRDVDSAAELPDVLEDVATRDRRRVDVAGSVLEGAPIPQQANTGQVDTPYTDTVLSEEVNYYRFEVPAGSTIRGEVLFAGTSELTCRAAVAGQSGLLGITVALTDDEPLPHGSQQANVGWVNEPNFATSKDVEWNSGEVFLEIKNNGCPPEAAFELQLQLTVEG